MKARGIDPAAVTPEWTGTINFNLSGYIDVPRERPFQARVSGEILSSTLRGRALEGSLQASMLGDDLIIQRMILRGNGFDIDGYGDMRKRLTVRANITDLSSLVPDSKGSLSIGGWMSVEGWVKGSALVKGSGLSIHGVRIGSANLIADFFSCRKEHFKLRADVRGLGYRSSQIDSVLLDVGGSTSHHTIALSLGSGRSDLRAAMTGTYKDKRWDGRITELFGRDPVGPWHLESLARLHLSKDRVLVSQMVLKGANVEQISVQANLGMNPLNGSVSGEWYRLNLARANHLLHDMALSGNTSGKFRML